MDEKISPRKIQNMEKSVISLCFVLVRTGRKAQLARSHNSQFCRHCHRETWGNSHFDLAGEGRVAQASRCSDLVRVHL